jgi:hypothetical protein
VPPRLKAQLDWLVRDQQNAGQATQLRQMAEDALRTFVHRELEARGMIPVSTNRKTHPIHDPQLENPGLVVPPLSSSPQSLDSPLPTRV